MRGMVKLWALALLGTAAFAPAPVHGQTVSRADLVGAWRSLYSESVEVSGDSVIVRTPRERLLTLRDDGTLATRAWFITKDGKPQRELWALHGGNGPLAERGRWSLAGDTLVLDYLPGDTLEIDSLKKLRWDTTLTLQVGDTTWKKRQPYPLKRYKLGREGAKLMMETYWKHFPEELDRVDTTKMPPPVLPPATVNRADLAGSWVTRSVNPDKATDTIVDTLTLRADGTWTASAFTVGQSKPPSSGKWYLGAGNIVVLVDEHQAVQSSAMGRWRGGKVKVSGRQLLVGPPYALELTYDRL